MLKRTIVTVATAALTLVSTAGLATAYPQRYYGPSCADSEPIRATPGGKPRYIVHRGNNVSVFDFRDGVWAYVTYPARGYFPVAALCEFQ